MSSLNNRQSGFGALAVITLIAVVVIIGAAGFGVYKNQHKNTTAMTTATPSPEPQANPVQPPTTAPATPVQQLKSVPELGIKFYIADSLTDLTYYVHDVQLSNGKTAKAVSFSTEALTTADPQCSAETGAPLGGFTIGQGQYPKDDENVGTDYGKLVKQGNSSFIAFTSPQGSCSQNATALKINGDAQTAFGPASQTVDFTAAN